MNDILFELLKLIVMIAVLLVMRYAIPWLRSRIGVEKMAEIEKWAEKAVLMPNSPRQASKQDKGMNAYQAEEKAEMEEI